MTEEEWLAAEHPNPLLTCLHDTASERKLRLFGCACCWRIEHLLSLPHFIQTVEVSESFADDRASDEERRAAHKVVNDHIYAQTPEHGRLRFSDFAVAEAAEKWPVDIVHPIESARRVASNARDAMERDDAYRARLATGPPEPELRFPHSQEQFAAFLAASKSKGDFEDTERQRLHAAEEARQVSFLRDIFGNPFRPLACEPAWRTSTVVALAEGIYADRAFDRMPILADALQDAGCDSDDILAHCRDTQLTHVRGCWVIDLLTGRA